MTIDRIVVGYDGNGPSRGALRWAVREAGRIGAVVHVVTAWTAAGDRPPGPVAIAGRLREYQAAAIRDALDRLPNAEQPVVTRSVVMADPATALASAAADADLVVIGSGTHIPHELKVRLEGWPRRYGGPCPIRVVRTLSTKDIRLEIRSLNRIPQIAAR